MDDKTYTLTKDRIKDIERILSNGNRVELIPVKNGIKVVQVKRETVSVPKIEQK